MDRTFRRWMVEGLVWLPEKGMGYYPVQGAPYDAAYFDRYQGYAATEMGRALTQARVDLVARHYQGALVDIGIGSGQFVEARPETRGYDVNPAGVSWLRERGLFRDPCAGPIAAASFWDSLEHIAEPAPLLANISAWVFVSLPIFDGPDHVLRSKHFRPHEHVYYWTREGFVAWMTDQGFALAERNDAETELGRAGIESFAFRRASPAPQG